MGIFDFLFGKKKKTPKTNSKNISKNKERDLSKQLADGYKEKESLSINPKLVKTKSNQKKKITKNLVL